jgi:hypothetical protein
MKVCGAAVSSAVKPKKARTKSTTLAAVMPMEIAMAERHPVEREVVSKSMVSAPGVAAATNQMVAKSQ